jgi:hypothetical protein
MLYGLGVMNNEFFGLRRLESGQLLGQRITGDGPLRPKG